MVLWFPVSGDRKIAILSAWKVYAPATSCALTTLKRLRRKLRRGMTGVERILSWFSVLIFVLGALGLFLRIRHWYQHRGWPDPLKVPADDEDHWPKLRNCLRNDK